MNKKILISDYDQTFYLNDIDIQLNKIAVDDFRKQGNIFIFATGRSYLDFKRIVDKYNLSYDYAILNHGTTILDNDDNIIDNIFINNDILNNLEEALELKKATKCFCCSKLKSRLNFKQTELTKIHVEYGLESYTVAAISKVKRNYSDFLNLYRIGKTTIEIISSKANKAVAIKKLLKHLNFDKNDIYVVGDGSSDYEMIKEFNGYAMDNALPQIKKVAKNYTANVSSLINKIM